MLCVVFKVSSVYQTQVSYYSLPSFFGMARPPKKPPGTTRSESESDHGLADDNEEAEKKPAARRVSHGTRDPIKEAIDREFTVDSEEDKEQTNDNENDKVEESSTESESEEDDSDKESDSEKKEAGPKVGNKTVSPRGRFDEVDLRFVFENVLDLSGESIDLLLVTEGLKTA